MGQTARAKSDKVLETKIRKGDKEAFQTLYLKYRASMGNFIRCQPGMLEQKNINDLVEDIISEAFERAWTNHSSFKSWKSTFKTWVFTIAKNICTDILRRQNMARQLVLDRYVHHKGLRDSTKDSIVDAIINAYVGFSFKKGEEEYVPKSREERMRRFYEEEEERLTMMGFRGRPRLPKLYLYTHGLVKVSKRERAIINEILKWTPRSEIAKRVGLNAAALDTAISRIKLKFL